MCHIYMYFLLLLTQQLLKLLFFLQAVLLENLKTAVITGLEETNTWWWTVLIYTSHKCEHFHIDKSSLTLQFAKQSIHLTLEQNTKDSGSWKNQLTLTQPQKMANAYQYSIKNYCNFNTMPKGNVKLASGFGKKYILRRLKGRLAVVPVIYVGE